MDSVRKIIEDSRDAQGNVDVSRAIGRMGTGKSFAGINSLGRALLERKEPVVIVHEMPSHEALKRIKNLRT